MYKLLAIDPGNRLSGWVSVTVALNGTIAEILHKGKSENETVVSFIQNGSHDQIVCEEIAGGWGETVSKCVFETAYQIGEFRLSARQINIPFELLNRHRVAKAFRVKTSDKNIRRAVINRYAPFAANDGKGTKDNPGFFFGMAADAWQAFALADAYCIRNPHKVRQAT
jgi:hypothetical protein